MKKIMISVALVITTGIVSAQKKTETVVIKTTAQCEMCEEKLENNLSFEKGVKKAELDLKANEITVTFNTGKTDLEKIRKAISELGYDADDVKANPEVYEKLPACCKKPE